MLSALAGPLGPLVDLFVRQAVRGAIESPRVPIESSAAPQAANTIAREVVEKLAASPEAQHLTNTEPPWRSRVTLGALGAILSGLAGLAMAASQGDVSLDAFGPHILAIGGGAFTLYGRWIASRPIGS